ncbi:hypothetical protein GMST_17110 [Geomonas silvestris]|uniref:Uncharacterized protein n=1 Tax=Geomonas silvestris TaxID=2740184 RepID=A0A6V8MHC4_9BACT|nr:tetratricopeptide repeat protein [Geomonas silvestris]GFO59386.1 hypothetical protein GMST_17110 [Geomonas silvestris]
MNPQKPFLALAVLAAFGLVPALGHADYDAAVKAYKSGDFVTAYQEYLNLAKAGDARAQSTVACMLQAGEGVTRNPEEALPWLKKAAESGVTPAQYSLGKAYENGLGTERDLAKALVWYGIASEHGDAKALENFKRLDALRQQPAASAAKPQSVATVPTPVPAVTVKTAPVAASPQPAAVAKAVAPPATAVALASTAEVDDMPELRFGSMMAQKAEPVPAAHPAAAPVPKPAAKPATPAPKTAAAPAPKTVAAPAPKAVASAAAADLSPFGKKRKAAESGDVEAQLYLGWCYSSGKEVPQDKQEAVVWYKKAAQAGSLKAQTALGWMFFSGEAGTKDLKEAALWYKKAAAQCDARANGMLKRIELATAKH